MFTICKDQNDISKTNIRVAWNKIKHFLSSRTAGGVHNLSLALQSLGLIRSGQQESQMKELRRSAVANTRPRTLTLWHSQFIQSLTHISSLAYDLTSLFTSEDTKRVP
jgi:hypothetical protein